MSASKRVQQEPAWLLHHRPFRDSSRILDVLSRSDGRLSLVARGSRSGKSRLRGLLRPFLPLQLSWVIRSDLGTLTGAEMNGEPIALSGDALLSAYYINELLLHLLHRHDPQPEIFDAYSKTIVQLAGGNNLAILLRQFEIELLRALGYALNLDHDTQSLRALVPDAYYLYRVEQGPVPVSEQDGPMVFRGDELLAIREQDFTRPEVLRSASRLLRDVIAFHLGGKELKSRKVMRQMKRGNEQADAGLGV